MLFQELLMLSNGVKCVVKKKEDFYKLRREKLDRITKVKGIAKTKARLDMALFLLGNGYGYEATGVLKLIKPRASDVKANQQYRFLRGATDFLMGRYKDALGALMHPSIFGNDEGEYWRAAAKIAAGEDVLNAAKMMNAKGRVFAIWEQAAVRRRLCTQLRDGSSGGRERQTVLPVKDARDPSWGTRSPLLVREILLPVQEDPEAALLDTDARGPRSLV